MLKKSILLCIVISCCVEKNHGAASLKEESETQEAAAQETKIPVPLRLPDLTDITTDNVCEKTYDYLRGVLFASNTSLNRSSTWSAGKHSPRHDTLCTGDNFKTHSPRNQEHFETLVQPSLQPIKDFITKLRDKTKKESNLLTYLNKIPTSLQHTHHFSVWYFFTEFSQQDLRDVFRKMYNQKPIAAIDAITSKFFSEATCLPIGDMFVWFLQRHINNAVINESSLDTRYESYFDTLDIVLENNQKLFDDCSMLFGFAKTKLRVKNIKRSTSATLVTPRTEAAKKAADQPDITPTDLPTISNGKNRNSLDPHQEIPAFYQQRRRPSVSTASKQNILPRGRNSDPTMRNLNRNFTNLGLSNLPITTPEGSGTPKGPRSQLSSSSAMPFNKDTAIVNHLSTISDKVSMADFVACFTQEIQILKTPQQLIIIKKAWDDFLTILTIQEEMKITPQELALVIDKFGITDALLNEKKQAIDEFNALFNEVLNRNKSEAVDYNVYQIFKQLYDEKVATLDTEDKGKEEAAE